MSERSRLVFERIDIRRMPGIETGFSVEGLKSGVNVIYGPNGSGKTSLTRALVTLLWKQTGSADRSIVSGTFRFDRRLWQISYDSGRRRCQADGHDSDFPRIDATDVSDRYVLALHDLLLASDEDFAAAILRESTGGYDVTKAASQLGYASRPSTSRNLERALNSARQVYREALGGQEALRQRERDRESLLERQQDALAAAKRVTELEHTRDYQSALLSCEQANRRLEQFPTVLANVTGAELEELSRLHTRRLDLEKMIAAERLSIERARGQQAATRLAEPVPASLLIELRQRCQRLRDLERDVQTATTDWNAAETQVATIRRRIGIDISDEQLSAFDARQLDAVARLMRESQQAHARFDALRELAEMVPTIDANRDLASERERLSHGIRYLNNWLRQPSFSGASEANWTVLLLVTAGLAALEAVLLGVLVHPMLFVLCVISLVMVGIGIWTSSSTRVDGSDADRWRREYVALGLSGPADWDRHQVETCADELGRQLRLVELDQSARERWQHIHRELPGAQMEAESVDRQITSILHSFGITSITDVSALHALAHSIVDWQHARVQADDARVRRISAVNQYQAERQSFNRQLSPYSDAQATDPASAIALTDVLTQRENERVNAAAEERRSVEQVDGPLRQQRDSVQSELKIFFDRFELQPDDEFGLRTLLEQFPEFKDATADAKRAALELERAERVLDGAALIDVSLDELDAALQVAQKESAALDDIRNEIAKIEAEIWQAKRGRGVEQALAAEQAAADALRDAREGAERLVSGWTLAEFVAQRTRDVDRPEVFHRARELFARITQGRYELQVDGSDQPTFRARDTVTGLGHGLDELSSGTRLQLLLAVRVAFVEQQEQGPMLPLVFDETLGNSDEYRAQAIIGAAIQMARDGRQVLYLTAQHDEVHKWSAIMDGVDDVEFAIVDLAEVRGLADWDRVPPAPLHSWVIPDVPVPDGLSREAYGALLHVPGIDVTADDSGGLHLWHLVDDLETLHQLLSNHIENWGQLRTLVEIGGADALRISPDVIDRCAARVQVIDVVSAARRVGMGRPVDRAVLLDSGAITSVFIDRVSELAAELSGDGPALIEALDAGQISRFHTSARNNLNEYLEEHGYIDRSAPLTLDEARGRALAAAIGAIDGGLLTLDWVNQTLQTLWRVSSADEQPQIEEVR